MSKDGIYQVFDWTEVRFYQIVIFFASAIIFPLYAVALISFGLAFAGLMLYIANVSTQIPFGLLVTRFYHILGMYTKKRLKLIDPAVVDTSWGMSNQLMSLEEISHLFDEISVELQTQSPSVDDILDLTWFAVIVWAAISTTALAVLNPPPLFLASAALIHAGLCFASLYNGYRIAPSPPFDENMEHLRHFVSSRLSALNAVIGERDFQPGISLLSKGHKQIINDFFVQVLNLSRDKAPVLTYWIGISSTDAERIDFAIENDQVRAVQDSLEHHPIVTESGWSVSVSNDSNEPGVLLTNEQSELRIDVQSTMVHSPSWIAETSKNLADALSAVLPKLDI